MNYHDFLASKTPYVKSCGVSEALTLNHKLFPFQSAVVTWALRMGRAAIFAECGLGKTAMQLEWANRVPGDVLVLAPLAVSSQTAREADKFDIAAIVSDDGTKRGKITITNYEKLEKFDPADFQGIVLDESSILKSFDGKTRTRLIRAFGKTPYKLACTATPAPNDHMELGNHAEFLGVMTRSEMLASFFVHDGGDTSQWRLKGHAEDVFWRWVASWSMMLRTPSDIGYPDDGYVLPPLTIHEHVINTGERKAGRLFVESAQGLNEQRKARRLTLHRRVEAVAKLVNESDEPWGVWCELNDEGDALEAAIPMSVQVSGADDDDAKISKMMGFSDGEHRVLITKPKIGGFGMNWQHCPNVAFVGLSNSYEQFYQAVRRFYRFGQTKPVNVHVITTDIEVGVVDNIKRKQAAAETMAREMVRYMGDSMRHNLTATTKIEDVYVRDVAKGDGYVAHLGDSCEIIREIPADSIHYTIFSPPFASLYTYSNSTRDLGNCSTHEQFFEHFKWLAPEILRVTIPGRLMSFHCMNLPTMKERDGFIGLTDFRGDLIRLFVDAGWVFHSEVCIWKDPVTQMQRTKALGLLHKQLKKDSCMSRQGLADYVVTMRKPGENPERVGHTNETFPVEKWQNYASPVWMDIDPSDTLQRDSAREDKDERHICPLQLGVIRRCIELWTNPGDTVFSPFGGIGSEGYVALDEGRKALIIELKRSYWEQASRNLEAASMRRRRLFA